MLAGFKSLAWPVRPAQGEGRGLRQNLILDVPEKEISLASLLSSTLKGAQGKEGHERSLGVLTVSVSDNGDSGPWVLVVMLGSFAAHWSNEMSAGDVARESFTKMRRFTQHFPDKAPRALQHESTGSQGFLQLGREQCDNLWENILFCLELCNTCHHFQLKLRADGENFWLDVSVQSEFYDLFVKIWSCGLPLCPTWVISHLLWSDLFVLLLRRSPNIHSLQSTVSVFLPLHLLLTSPVCLTYSVSFPQSPAPHPGSVHPLVFLPCFSTEKHLPTLAIYENPPCQRSHSLWNILSHFPTYLQCS